MSGRWSDYVIAYGGPDDQASSLWLAAAEATNPGRGMYVLGVGFDPRALVGLQQFLALDHLVPPVVGRIELPPPSAASGATTRTLATDNQAAFEDLVLRIETRTVAHEEVHTRTNAGPRVARALTADSFVDGIGYIVVDISSLPASLYFPMIAALLASVERRPNFPSEILVVACENPEIDAAITELGVGDASVLGGFRGPLEHESDPTGTVIWAPVIGEKSGSALQAIHDFLSPGAVRLLFSWR